MTIIHLLIANGLSQDCVVDSVISDLPFTHTDSTTGRGDDWSFAGYTDGEDYTYQLTLTTPRTIYIDTCDPYSNYDTIIAIKDTSQCQLDASLQEHDDADQDFCPVGASNIDPSWYASLIDSFPLNPGTYYIVVDGYNAQVGNFGIAIGALPEIDTSYIASDDSYIEVVFSDPVYTLASATGGLQINDFEIEFSQNGGNATNVEISNLTNLNGGGLVGGEDTIRINIAVTPGGQSSGVETLSIRPVDRNSIFNSFGIGLSRSSVVIANLTDYYPPIANFLPANDTINPSQDIIVQFNEPIRLINNTNVDNTNIQNLFTLAYADTGTSSIDFVASVDTDDQQFTLNPDVNLDERRTIMVTYAANTFEDFGNNALPANNKELIVNDVTAGVVTDSLLEENNTFLYLSFNEGVYTNASGTGGLNSSDIEISNFVDGNATTGNITGMTSEIGTTLNGGELTIRMTLQFDNIPDGTESITIRPKANQVFDDFGNPMDVNTNARTFNLFDALAPTATFTPDPSGLILPNELFTITFSEAIRLLNDSTITNNILNSIISIQYVDGDEENIPFFAIIEGNVITINPNSSLIEMRSLRIVVADTIEDFSDNQTNSFSVNYTVQDISPPTVNTQSTSISTSNVFVVLSFSESVYTNNNGTGSLELSDFILEFSDNGGNATDVTMVDLQRPGPSGPLLGGEDSIWVYLSIDGTPSGEETFTIKSNGNEEIFDGSGNPLAFPTNSTSEITLNPYPRLTGNSLENNNVYVELEFSEGIFSASDTSSGVEVTDFDISFSQNSGNANDAVINSLTKTNGTPLSGNESTIRVVLNISSPPPSGLETIQITPTNAYAICNSLGNRLSVSECTVNLTLIDRLVPTINDINIVADSIVTITSSEDMYNNLGATGAVSTNHFQATVYANNGNASEATIINITNNNQGPLVGGEKIVRIGFVTDLLSSGVEEMTISPAGPAYPIYDPENNQMPINTISARVSLPDRLPPTIVSESAEIAVDNSYVEFSITEGVYGTYEVTNPVDPNDFEIVFIQNEGNASSASVDFITNENQFPVVGGEKILRCYLSFDAAPSGHEQLYIRAANGYSVFDLAGNSIGAEQVTDTLQLSDQLVPTVSSISIPHGSSISSSTDQPINITFSEPIQSFNYSISARHYNSLSWDTTESSDANQFQLTLNKPMASLDTITITISSLTDSAGLEAVDFSYEFYTPALGDYDTSGRIDIEDLTRFVTFWLADSEAIFNGLGPTTGQLPHFVPHLDHQYDLDDGMTFIRMWSWSINEFGYEPLDVLHIGSPLDWNDFIEEVPREAISGQLYVKYDPEKGNVNLNHTSFGPQNLTLLKNSNEKGEILLEFGMLKPDNIKRIIKINASVDEPTDATVIYKFFDTSQKVISSGLQKIQLLIPTDYMLKQNYPNPFNYRTTISYAVPNKSFVKIDIIDINGRLVETLVSNEHDIGFYKQNWSGRNVASGIYFIKLTAEKKMLTQKMILLK